MKLGHKIKFMIRLTKNLWLMTATSFAIIIATVHSVNAADEQRIDK
jgi:hypothetical protein